MDLTDTFSYIVVKVVGSLNVADKSQPNSNEQQCCCHHRKAPSLEAEFTLDGIVFPVVQFTW